MTVALIAILGVLGYEFLVANKNPFAVGTNKPIATGATSKQQTTAPATSSAAVTQMLSAVASLLKGGGGGSRASLGSGGGGAAGIPSSQGGKASQTGQSQASNQVIDLSGNAINGSVIGSNGVGTADGSVTSPDGSVIQQADGTLIINGQLYDSNGNPIDLTQTAPGDGLSGLPTALFTPLPSNVTLDAGAVDVGGIVNAVDTSLQLDAGGGPPVDAVPVDYASGF